MINNKRGRKTRMMLLMIGATACIAQGAKLTTGHRLASTTGATGMVRRALVQSRLQDIVAPTYATFLYNLQI